MSELNLLLSTFGVVFFMGFQGLCVNSGFCGWAVVNSILIGSFNLVLFKVAPTMTTPLEMFCFVAGGPVAIVCAMWVHAHVVVPRQRRSREAREPKAPKSKDPLEIRLTVR